MACEKCAKEMAAAPVHIPAGQEYAEEVRQFQGVPGIERTTRGRLFATWYGGGAGECEKNLILLALSNDDGATWDQSVLAVDPEGEVRAFDPVLWIDPLGRLWLFWSQAWQGTGGWVGVWAVRCDEPDASELTWTEPKRLCNGIMMNKPTVYGDEWFLPTSIWKKSPVIDALKTEQHSNVVVSADKGETWQLRGSVDVPLSDCDENMLVERRDGSLWMLVRTTYGIGETFSRNGGRSWSPGMPVDLPAVVSRFYIRRLQSGRLLFISHAQSRPDERIECRRPTRSHLTAYLSEDDGRSWSGGLLLDERLDVAYPDATQAASGEIYAIYDRERTKAGEIIMSVFTEEDILAGDWVSSAARERVVISRLHLQTKDK
jgi:predicted neuraminidase